MTATATEVDNLEETWLEKSSVCELGHDCEREATWLVTVTCPCRKRRYLSCESCRQWLDNVLKSPTVAMECTSCHASIINFTWLSL